MEVLFFVLEQFLKPAPSFSSKELRLISQCLPIQWLSLKVLRLPVSVSSLLRPARSIYSRGVMVGEIPHGTALGRGESASVQD